MNQYELHEGNYEQWYVPVLRSVLQFRSLSKQFAQRYAFNVYLESCNLWQRLAAENVRTSGICGHRTKFYNVHTRDVFQF